MPKSSGSFGEEEGGDPREAAKKSTGSFGEENAPDPAEAGGKAWHGNRKRMLEEFGIEVEEEKEE